MFNNSNQKSNNMSAEAMNSNNIIGKGSTFTGNVETAGNIRVEGKIIGDITCKAKVAIGPSAIIEGNIRAQIVEVEGQVIGSLIVSDNLILKPSCVINGDIIANKLIVEAGAKFDGKCKMGQQNMKILLKEEGEVNKDSDNLKKAI
jgi:cytoskeletal protein CcmA (bactofilin family)